MPKPCQ